MNKTYLRDCSLHDLIALKARGNKLLLDFVDWPFVEAYCGLADGLIASSRLQYFFFCRNFPAIHTAFIPHHVDLRCSSRCPTAQEFSCVYVGDPDNAAMLDELTRSGECTLMNPRNYGDVSWMERLADFNAHYMVRQKRKHDGFKPFTKGYLAAHCGAVCLVDRNDEEAIHHLTPAYPFVCDGSSQDSIRSAFQSMREAFLGPQWKIALMIMDEVRWLSSKERMIWSIQKAFRTVCA